jgi:PLP dependent protein
MDINNFHQIKEFCLQNKVELVAVSKTQPTERILDLYQQNQKIFGENRVQELNEKYHLLPKDIQWHLIGSLQKNKVKYIAPYVSLIHSVESMDLAKEIQKQALKNNRIISILIQVYIAQEETKQGILPPELDELVQFVLSCPNINLMGLMGMASNSKDENLVKKEFDFLNSLFLTQKEKYPLHFQILSMGMSGDYKLAINQGSNMVRIGSLLFN